MNKACSAASNGRRSTAVTPPSDESHATKGGLMHATNNEAKENGVQKQINMVNPFEIRSPIDTLRAQRRNGDAFPQASQTTQSLRASRQLLDTYPLENNGFQLVKIKDPNNESANLPTFLEKNTMHSGVEQDAAQAASCGQTAVALGNAYVNVSGSAFEQLVSDELVAVLMENGCTRPAAPSEHFSSVCPAAVLGVVGSPFSQARIFSQNIRTGTLRWNSGETPFVPRKKPLEVVSTPLLQNDFYLNLLDWSQANALAVGLQDTVAIWRPDITHLTASTDENDDGEDSSDASETESNVAGNRSGDPDFSQSSRCVTTSGIPRSAVRLRAPGLRKTAHGSEHSDGLTVVKDGEGAETGVASVAWNPMFQGTLAVGYRSGALFIWDVETQTVIRSCCFHQHRIGTLDWGSATLLTSGSRDKFIAHRDMRIPGPEAVFRWEAHNQEVCGVRWSPLGLGMDCVLASGGNDNHVFLWKLGYATPIAQLTEHSAAVKALSWSPRYAGVLATGGGTNDRRVRLWDVRQHTSQEKSTSNWDNALLKASNKTCYPQCKLVSCVDSGSQVCNALWSKNTSQLLTTHGFTLNDINVWNVSRSGILNDGLFDENASSLDGQTVSRPAEKNDNLTIQDFTVNGHKSRVLFVAMRPFGDVVVTGAGDETLRFWRLFPTNEHQSVMGQASTHQGSGVYINGPYINDVPFYRSVSDQPSEIRASSLSSFQTTFDLNFTEMKIFSGRSERFSMVECGSQHTVLLSEDHVSVYGWGSNAWGQLGCAAAQQEPVDMPSYARGQAAPQTDANVHPQHFSKPLKLLISSYGRVAKVSCGLHHTLALLDDGSVYSWGNGDSGRLGHGNTLTLSRPKRLAALEPYVVEDVSAGYFHSVCVTREPRGWMFSWGSNSAGQLGITRSTEANDNNQCYYLPSLVTSLLPGNLQDIKRSLCFNESNQEDSEPLGVDASECVEKVFGGGVHTAVLTSQRYVIAFGNNDSEFRCVKLNGAPPSLLFSQVSLGYNYGLLLTPKGRVGWWSIALVPPAAETRDNSIISASPLLELSDEFFVNIFSGPFFGAAVSQTTRVFFWRHKAIDIQLAQKNESAQPVLRERDVAVNLDASIQELVPVLIDHLTGLGVVSIGGTYDHLVAVANRSIFADHVVRCLLGASSVVALSSSTVFQSLSNETSILTQILGTLEALASPSFLAAKVEESPDVVSSLSTHSKAEVFDGISLDMLFPSLLLHPALALDLSAVLKRCMRQNDWVKACLQAINERSICNVERNEPKLQDALGALVRVAITESEPLTDPPSVASALLMSTATELRSSQQLTVALLAALLQADAQTITSEKEKQQLQNENKRLAGEIAALRESVDKTNQVADIALRDAERKLQERELKWRNTVQHLRQQLDARRRIGPHQPEAAGNNASVSSVLTETNDVA